MLDGRISLASDCLHGIVIDAAVADWVVAFLTTSGDSRAVSQEKGIH